MKSAVAIGEGPAKVKMAESVPSLGPVLDRLHDHRRDAMLPAVRRIQDDRQCRTYDLWCARPIEQRQIRDRRTLKTAASRLLKPETSKSASML